MIRRPRRRAFSLVELASLVAILAITAAVVVPRYGQTLARYRASAAAGRVAADVNLARTRARYGSAGQSVVFDADAYTLPGLSGFRGATAYAVSLADEPYRATVLANPFASGTIAFDRYGRPAAGGTLVVQSGSATRSVVVDAVTGQASVP